MSTLICLAAIPVVLALASAIIGNPRRMRLVISAGMWAQVAVVVSIVLPLVTNSRSIIEINQDMVIDRLSALFLVLTNFVVACSITHAHQLFCQEETELVPPSTKILRLGYACACLFALSMTMVFICNNLGYLWIAIEATTLSSAPLVYFTRTKHALEATWKYLIICSVGIAFALLGTVLIFASSQHGASSGGTLNIGKLIADATHLHGPLLRLGFVFCFLGYGTKAGMFPLHSWLPDAHSEAPAFHSAMLSGALLNCALFGIWRTSQILMASQHVALMHSLIIWLGAITTLAAALFLVRQHGFKRLWAYSSIENVGLMLVAIGVGSGALFFLQALNHSLAKVSLFLLSGNIVQATKSKELSDLKGIASLSPAWGLLLALSAFAVTGAPPFGAFLSEWLILTNSLNLHQFAIVGILIVALAISFIAVSIHLSRVLLGKPKPDVIIFKPVSTSAIPALLVVSCLALGFMTDLRCLTVCP